MSSDEAPVHPVVGCEPSNGEKPVTWNRCRHAPPHHTCDWVKIDVYIRRLSDGEERVYHTDGLLEDDDATLATYIWEEGNYSCDCNRYLFFQRAANEPELDDGGPCGHDGYLVWIVNPATGETVYDERKASKPKDHRADAQGERK